MSASQSQQIGVGTSIGPYRIEGVLGAGGMGVVYLAEDCDLRRRVAIKVVERSHRSAAATRLLLREARAAAALNHPAICAVHEIGHLGGEPFIVLEHVQGVLLCDAIARECGLGLETAIHYVIQIVDAVGHAHQHGIVHGDLTTSNVIVGGDGRLKILDFGLAVERVPETDDVETTSPSEAMSGAGTIPYMSPERLRGLRADERSDIWAIGVVFFEMLAGIRPFRGGTTYEKAAAILGDPPAPLPPRTPSAVRAIVGRCLAKHPADRFQSARELAGGLDDLDPDISRR